MKNEQKNKTAQFGKILLATALVLVAISIASANINIWNNFIKNNEFTINTSLWSTTSAWKNVTGYAYNDSVCVGYCGQQHPTNTTTNADGNVVNCWCDNSCSHPALDDCCPDKHEVCPTPLPLTFGWDSLTFGWDSNRSWIRNSDGDTRQRYGLLYQGVYLTNRTDGGVTYRINNATIKYAFYTWKYADNFQCDTNQNNIFHKPAMVKIRYYTLTGADGTPQYENETIIAPCPTNSGYNLIFVEKNTSQFSYPVYSIENITLHSGGRNLSTWWIYFKVEPILLPDLNFVGGMTFNQIFREDRTMKMNVTITNSGTNNTNADIDTTFYLYECSNSQCTSRTLISTNSQIKTGGLNVGQTHTMEFSMPITPISRYYQFEFKIDPLNTIIELEKGNNLLSDIRAPTAPCTTNWALSISPNPQLIGYSVTALGNYQPPYGFGECSGESLKIIDTTGIGALYWTSAPVVCTIPYNDVPSTLVRTCNFNASNSPEEREYRIYFQPGGIGTSLFFSNPAYLNTTYCLGNVSLNIVPNYIGSAIPSVSANVALGTNHGIYHSFMDSNREDGTAGIFSLAQKFVFSERRGIQSLSLALYKYSNCLETSKAINIRIVGHDTSNNRPNLSAVYGSVTIYTKDLPYSTPTNEPFDAPFTIVQPKNGTEPVVLNAGTYWIIVEDPVRCGLSLSIGWRFGGTGSGLSGMRFNKNTNTWSNRNGNYTYAIQSYIPGKCAADRPFKIQQSICGVSDLFSEKHEKVIDDQKYPDYLQTEQFEFDFPYLSNLYQDANKMFYLHNATTITAQALCQKISQATGGFNKFAIMNYNFDISLLHPGYWYYMYKNWQWAHTGYPYVCWYYCGDDSYIAKHACDHTNGDVIELSGYMYITRNRVYTILLLDEFAVPTIDTGIAPLHVAPWTSNYGKAFYDFEETIDTSIYKNLTFEFKVISDSWAFSSVGKINVSLRLCISKDMADCGTPVYNQILDYDTISINPQLVSIKDVDISSRPDFRYLLLSISANGTDATYPWPSPTPRSTSVAPYSESGVYVGSCPPSYDEIEDPNDPSKKLCVSDSDTYEYDTYGQQGRRQIPLVYDLSASVKGEIIAPGICEGEILTNKFSGICEFPPPTESGVYEYWACMDKNANTIWEPGESDNDSLSVETCIGSFSMDFYTPVCNPSQVRVNITGTIQNEHCVGKPVVIKYQDNALCSVTIPSSLDATNSFSDHCFFDIPYFEPYTNNPLMTYGTFPIVLYVDQNEADKDLTVVYSLKLSNAWLATQACSTDDICYDYQGYPVCCDSQIKIYGRIENTGNIPGGINLTLNVTPVSEVCYGCEDMFFWKIAPGSGNRNTFFGFEEVIPGTNCSYNLTINVGTGTLVGNGFGLDCLDLTRTFYAPCVKYEPFKKYENVTLQSLPMHFFYGIKEEVDNTLFVNTVPNNPVCCPDRLDPYCGTNNLFRTGYIHCCYDALFCACDSCEQTPTNSKWCPRTTDPGNYDNSSLLATGPWKYLFATGFLDWTNLGIAQGYYTHVADECDQNQTRYAYPDIFVPVLDPSSNSFYYEWHKSGIPGTETRTSIPSTGGCIRGTFCQYDTYRVDRHKYTWTVEYDMAVNTYSKNEFVPVYIGHNMSISVPVSGEFEQLSRFCSGNSKLCYTELPFCGDGICDVRSGERCWNCDEDCSCKDNTVCSICNVPEFTDSKGCAESYKQHGETCTCEYGECDPNQGLACVRDESDLSGSGHCCYDQTKQCDPGEDCAAEIWDSELNTCRVERSITVSKIYLDIRQEYYNYLEEKSLPHKKSGNESCAACAYTEFYSCGTPGMGTQYCLGTLQTVADLNFEICNNGPISEIVNITMTLPQNLDVMYGSSPLSNCSVDAYGGIVCGQMSSLPEAGKTTIFKYNNLEIPLGCSTLANLVGSPEVIYCVHPNIGNRRGDPGSRGYSIPSSPIVATVHNEYSIDVPLVNLNAICNFINTIGGEYSYLNYPDDITTICGRCEDYPYYSETVSIGSKYLHWCTPIVRTVVMPCDPNDGYCDESNLKAFYYLPDPTNPDPVKQMGTPIKIEVDVASEREINQYVGHMIQSGVSSGELELVGSDRSKTTLLCDTMHSILPADVATSMGSGVGGHTCMTDNVRGTGLFYGSGFFGTAYSKTYGPFYGISKAVCDSMAS